MNIYISGISGTGMGPLALMAKKAGMNVYGSDRSYGAIAPELEKAGIEYHVGSQDGRYLSDIMEKQGIDWFVYTSALPQDHPELVLARDKGIKVSKRDELIAMLVRDLNLKMVAVAGTHGKTTTTAMLVWAIRNLLREDQEPLLPSSYLVGTILPFTASGSYKEGDEFFIYEADEYDRNFLHFSPWLSLITYVSYDHPDIYTTREDYEEAFRLFESQSEKVIFGSDAAALHGLKALQQKGKNPVVVHESLEGLDLAGAPRREDATMAFLGIKEMLAYKNIDLPDEKIREVLNAFPGARRRFERLCDGVYSDYAHHPEEVKATIGIALEEASKLHKKGVVTVYQPHQNTRQHEVRSLYRDAFCGADRIYWLPTFLTRENESLPVIRPEEFISELEEREKAFPAEADEKLAETLQKLRNEGYLILLLTAGPADQWYRKIFL